MAPWPEPDEATPTTGARSSASRRRPRSSAAAACVAELEGDERRIFEAVVRPERVKADGNAEAEIERLARRSPAPKACSRTSGSTSNAPAEVVEAEREKLERYRRELDAIGN